MRARRGVGPAALAVIMTLAGGACSGTGGARVAKVNKSFPLPATADLVVRLASGASRPEVRRITTDLAGAGGVEAAEAHYDLGEMRIVVSTDMSVENRRRLRARLLEHPEVASVELHLPED